MEQNNQARTQTHDEVIEGGVVKEYPNRGVDFLPKLKEAEFDEKLYAAWSEHMIRGFEQNSVMFKQILGALMRPYWLTVAMYVALFVIGLGGFVAAVYFSVTRSIELGLLFGGLTVGAFLTFFISRPLRALEQNLLFITWLGVIYNTYWSRLMYTNQMETVQEDLDAIEDNAIRELNKLVNKQDKLSSRRPGKLEDDT
jgi:hypothetical protein